MEVMSWPHHCKCTNTCCDWPHTPQAAQVVEGMHHLAQRCHRLSARIIRLGMEIPFR